MVQVNVTVICLEALLPPPLLVAVTRHVETLDSTSVTDALQFGLAAAALLIDGVFPLDVPRCVQEYV